MPVSEQGYHLLVCLAVKNPCLAAEDRAVLKEVIHGLDIQNSDTLLDVNDKWSIQQRMEANLIYLLVKYESFAAKQEGFVEEVEAAEYLSLPDSRQDGKKYTVEEKKQLVKVEPTVTTAKQMLLEAQELASLVNKLSRTVFGRNQKLDHMGVNYRRELSYNENCH